MVEDSAHLAGLDLSTQPKEQAMPRVTITVGNVTVTIASLADAEQPSVDVRTLPEPIQHANLDGVRGLIAQLAQNVGHRVNCTLGQHRSPTVAILYLWRDGAADRLTLGAVFQAFRAAYAAAGVNLSEQQIKDSLFNMIAPHLEGRLRRGAGFENISGLTYEDVEIAL